MKESTKVSSPLRIAAANLSQERESLPPQSSVELPCEVSAGRATPPSQSLVLLFWTVSSLTVAPPQISSTTVGLVKGSGLGKKDVVPHGSSQASGTARAEDLRSPSTF